MDDESQLGDVWREFFGGSPLVFLVLSGGLWTVPPRNHALQSSLAGKAGKPGF